PTPMLVLKRLSAIPTINTNRKPPQPQPPLPGLHPFEPLLSSPITATRIATSATSGRARRRGRNSPCLWEYDRGRFVGPNSSALATIRFVRVSDPLEVLDELAHEFAGRSLRQRVSGVPTSSGRA